jgi:hypothetical protein
MIARDLPSIHAARRANHDRTQLSERGHVLATLSLCRPKSEPSSSSTPMIEKQLLKLSWVRSQL